MDSHVTLLQDEQPVIKALKKRLDELVYSSAVTAVQQENVTKLYNLICAPSVLKGVKKHAQVNLRKILEHNRELFVLCGLATTFTAIGNIKTEKGLVRLLEWNNKEVTHSLALVELAETLLPKKSPPSSNTIQQDTKSTSAGTSQPLPLSQILNTISSPSRSNAIQQDTKPTSAFDSEHSRKRARLAADPPLDLSASELQSLLECRTILERLYPGRDIQSLCPLSREQLISLLGSSRQDLPSHAPSPDHSQDSQSSASSPEGQRIPAAEPLYHFPLEKTITPQASTSNPHSSNTDLETAKSSSIPLLSNTFPGVLSLPQAQPQTAVRNLGRKHLTLFLEEYKGGCSLEVEHAISSEDFETLNLVYKGSQNSPKFDGQITIRKDIFDALFVGCVGPNGIIKVLFNYLRLGDDPLEMVTEWSNLEYLPSITLPQGNIIMQRDVRTALLQYVKSTGTELEYWEAGKKQMELL